MNQFRNSDVIFMQVTQFTHALCLSVDPDAMHPADESATNPHNKMASNKAQKNLCLKCVHRSDCLELAIATKAEGIWGGTGTRDRKELIKLRKFLGENIPDAGVKLVVGRPKNRTKVSA